MAKARLSTTVDSELLARARALHVGQTDEAMLEAALKALLREHPEAEIDRLYLEAYRKQPLETPDEWGDLTSFLDAAGATLTDGPADPWRA